METILKGENVESCEDDKHSFRRQKGRIKLLIGCQLFFQLSKQLSIILTERMSKYDHTTKMRKFIPPCEVEHDHPYYYREGNHVTTHS